MKWVVFFVAGIALVRASDLDAIRETQKKLFAMRGKNSDVRGANPELTVLKHQLRDWAESQIVRSGPYPEVATLTATLDALFDQKKNVGLEDEWSGLGEVAPLTVSHPGGDSSWLKLEIGVGIECGFDESLYLYEWTGDAWIRRFESEQNDYRKDHYRPQYISTVAVGFADAQGNRLILTTGISPACASVWQELYYRLFRVGGDPAKLADEATLVNIDREVEARVEQNGATIQFLAGSRDAVVWARTHVVHLLVAGQKAQRVEPVALSAQDFVDEWLSGKWEDVAQFSDSKLESIHAELKKATPDEGFQLVQRCTEHPDQWQIAFDFEDDTYYFLIEQRSEYSYRMIDIADERQPGCPGEGEPRNLTEPAPTLFPVVKKQ